MEAQHDKVGLVVAELSGFPSLAIDILNRAGARATFVCAPHVLIGAVPAWKRAVGDGHELANGALVGVTLNGSIENWPPAALESELDEADRLLAELGQTAVCTCYLPGANHLGIDGNYRTFLESRYAICISDSDNEARIGALRLPIVRFESGMIAPGPAVVYMQGVPKDLGPLGRFLAESEAVSLSQLFSGSGERLEPKV